MVNQSVRVGAGGRIVLPSEVRSALGVSEGSTLILFSDGEGVRLLTPEQAVRRAQTTVAKYITPSRSLSEEILSERKDEPDAP